MILIHQKSEFQLAGCCKIIPCSLHTQVHTYDHSMAAQALRNVILHLQLITFIELSSADGKSHQIGSKILSVQFHPQFCGLRHLISKFFP